MNKLLFRLAAGKNGLVAASLLLPVLAFAQRFGGGDEPESIGEFEGIFDTIVAWLFSFLVLLSIVFVIIAAYKYLTSAGDPEKVKSASNTLIYAAVAIAVALLARGLPFLVSGLTGVEITGGGAGGAGGAGGF